MYQVITFSEIRLQNWHKHQVSGWSKVRNGEIFKLVVDTVGPGH